MKKKIITIAIVALIVIAAIIIVSLIKTNNYKRSDIVEISYSYGGGFGTIVDTSQKTITFYPNGEVKLSNNYNSYTETFNIDQNKYNELVDSILENFSLFDEKPKEEDALDGSSSSIKIKLKNGQSKEFGGYMINNKKYIKIKNKIYETIDYKRLNQYENNIKTNE